MSEKISPLAPETTTAVAPIAGVRLGAIEAGIRYAGRKDLMAIVFDKPAQIAGVFTTSKCPSAPVDFCRANLGGGRARADDRPGRRGLRRRLHLALLGAIPRNTEGAMVDRITERSARADVGKRVPTTRRFIPTDQHLRRCIEEHELKPVDLIS
mgnify:CR=1 FL=1